MTRLDWSVITAAGLAVLSCLRGPVEPDDDDGPSVDATVYARGFCSLRCWRLEECGLDDGVPREHCEMACVDDAVAQLPDDPCWAEWIEVRRCVVRWSACGHVRDEDAPTVPGSACESKAEDLHACES